MFKRLFVLLSVLAVLFVFAAPAHTQGARQDILIGANYEAYANPTDPILLYTCWGVCRAPGLLQAYKNAATHTIAVNGTTVFDGTNTKDRWVDYGVVAEDVPLCNNHPSDVYLSCWGFRMGVLPVGDYTIVTNVTLAHQVTDMYDAYFDGVNIVSDGIPDTYGPGTDTYTVILHVVE